MLPVVRRAAVVIGNGRADVTELSRLIGAPRTSPYSWKRVPAEYVLKIERATRRRVRRWEMRPDLYPRRV